MFRPGCASRGVCFPGEVCAPRGDVLLRGVCFLGGVHPREGCPGGVFASGVWFWGCVLPGGVLPGGVLLGGVSWHALRKTPPCEQNDRQV